MALEATAAMEPAAGSRPVAVLGASGFVGSELIRLVDEHPHLHVAHTAGRSSAGHALREVLPHLAATGSADLVVAPLDPFEPDALVAGSEIAFCALPRGRSAEIVPGLLAAGARAVIDLGGDFRLAAEDYPPWYGFEHPAPGLLAEAVYGLPEIFGSLIPGARLVANPGCFPTAALLGLVPLLHAGVLSDEHPIHVDGKTGTSGAGREAGETGSLATSQDSIRPYRVDAHQHTPEIERGLALATGRQVRVTFVPHLVPAVRGVMTTSYGRLAAPSPTEATSEVLTEILVEAYRDRPFVRVLPSHVPIDTKRTRAANVIELQVVAHPRSATAVVLAGIDNLVKGAAGQAIQNANLLFGLPETTGLPTTGVWP